MKIQYIEEVGMPTEEQIADKYENETWIKDQMGMQLGIPSDQVTMEQAHDLIITAFVREWQGFDFESLLEQWKTDIGFEVYLNEINGVNELESIEVPEIPAAEDEHREAEMEEAPEGSEGH
jgi:hypothetical protein